MIPQLELPGSSKKQEDSSSKDHNVDSNINSESKIHDDPNGNSDHISPDMLSSNEKNPLKLKKSVFGDHGIVNLSKTKISQANALLARHKRLLDKSVSLIKNESSLKQIEARNKQEMNELNVSNNLKKVTSKGQQNSSVDSGNPSALSGESESEYALSQLNDAVSNVQMRLLQLKIELDDAKDDEKNRNLLREEIEKLNYFLFQVSGFVAGSSSSVDSKDSVPAKTNLISDNSPRAQTPKTTSSGDLGLQSKAKSQGSRNGSSNFDHLIPSIPKQDLSQQSTTVALSGPISQVIAQNSRLGLSGSSSSGPLIDNDNNLRILSKRKIQELVSEIDPNERLEPEVEDKVQCPRGEGRPTSFR
ncbi:hypothetical protein AYI68_g2522 [Smittium mucronatum]|uniref:Uncharacterized protein n=1 Tax=Smittium mucronatum TaxID=133383 RepID=A0A1R0H2I3_9FUNG|nr:hypothetical protein AYI68_g2522 [Smittium mucronatum]